jgi:hypothetical protein
LGGKGNVLFISFCICTVLGWIAVCTGSRARVTKLRMSHERGEFVRVHEGTEVKGGVGHARGTWGCWGVLSLHGQVQSVVRRG